MRVFDTLPGNGGIEQTTGKGVNVPQVTIRTTVNGNEEALTEYICDWPDCPNVAVHVVGVVRELRICSAMCAEHAALVTNGGQ
jgi:hypothetical protein